MKTVFHGSKINNLNRLLPFSMNGENGSMDGIGINLTSSFDVASGFAGESGSVYSVSINESDYLEINNALITAEQSKKLYEKLKMLNEKDFQRLITDLIGMENHQFKDKNMAINFLKSEKISSIGDIDRIKPKASIDGDLYIVKSKRKNISSYHELMSIKKERLHYFLTLFSIEFATNYFESISKGISIRKENGENYYLSFSESEKIENEQKKSNKPVLFATTLSALSKELYKENGYVNLSSFFSDKNKTIKELNNISINLAKKDASLPVILKIENWNMDLKKIPIEKVILDEKCSCKKTIKIFNKIIKDQENKISLNELSL